MKIYIARMSEYEGYGLCIMAANSPEEARELMKRNNISEYKYPFIFERDELQTTLTKPQIIDEMGEYDES